MTGSTNKILAFLNKLIPDPKMQLNYTKDYELLLAVMLSAQTTDKRVNEVTSVLFKKYPTLDSLKKAKLDDLIEIIRPLGNYHKKAQYVLGIADRLDGSIPNDREFLESLPGVGRKTANVVLSTLFDEQYIAVDTHILRVSKRLGLANLKDGPLETEKKLEKKFKGYDFYRLHLQLLLFGRYTCTSSKPKCERCELFDMCKNKDKLKHERSCGTITYKIINNEVYYLVIKHKLGHYGFPKGHVENKETDTQTAYRETLEETNIKVKVDPSISYKITYSPYPHIIKDVIYFPAEYISGIDHPQEGETTKVLWLNEKDVLDILSFEDEKGIFIKINKYIMSRLN